MDLTKNPLILDEPDKIWCFEFGTWDTIYMKWISEMMEFPRQNRLNVLAGDVTIHEQFSVENCKLGV